MHSIVSAIPGNTAGNDSIMTGYGLDIWDSNSSKGKRFLLLVHSVKTCFVVHPAFSIMCAGALSLGVKKPELEADHTALSSDFFCLLHYGLFNISASSSDYIISDCMMINE
jgi:hypothetical protein